METLSKQISKLSPEATGEMIDNYNFDEVNLLFPKLSNKKKQDLFAICSRYCLKRTNGIIFKLNAENRNILVPLLTDKQVNRSLRAMPGQRQVESFLKSLSYENKKKFVGMLDPKGREHLVRTLGEKGLYYIVTSVSAEEAIAYIKLWDDKTTDYFVKSLSPIQLARIKPLLEKAGKKIDNGKKVLVKKHVDYNFGRRA